MIHQNYAFLQNSKEVTHDRKEARAGVPRNYHHKKLKLAHLEETNSSLPLLIEAAFYKIDLVFIILMCLKRLYVLV